MNDEHLLAEVEDLLRSTPPQSAFINQANDEALGWLGRTEAVLNEWNSTQSPFISTHISALTGEGIMQRRLSPLALPIVDSGPCYTGLDTIFG